MKETLKLRKHPDRQDLLKHFSTMKNSDGSTVEEKEVFFESANVVGAGADTTAISTRAILRYVCGSSRVYKKLQAEIDAASANGKLSPCTTFSEGQNLPYFQAIIKEALRLFPAGDAHISQLDRRFEVANVCSGLPTSESGP